MNIVQAKRRVLFFQKQYLHVTISNQNHYPILFNLFTLKMIFKITEQGMDKCYWEGGGRIMSEK
jgi:hypothetical protein